MRMVLPAQAPPLKRRRENGKPLLGIFGRGIPADKYSGDDEQDIRDMAAERA
jgi:hypothetical protein